MIKVKFIMGPAECNDAYIPTYSKQFLEKLSEELGEKLVCGEMDEVVNEELPIYFIASGGAEEEFKNIHPQTKSPYILLTHPAYNSLAAAMEIMGYLHENNKEGEIIHGSFKAIADRIRLLLAVARGKKKLFGMRLGCFGEPGGLIASTVDFDAIKLKSGIEMVMLDLNEVVTEFNKKIYPTNEYTEQLLKKNFKKDEIEKALYVYGALKRLIVKYNLQGITLRCFDLMELIHTTGCLALAILNAEGISAACEGDQKALLTMAIIQTLTDKSCFMANPSYMNPETSEIIFAHCTLPIDMPNNYELMTHFESGIGIAVTSDMIPQIMTIFKVDSTLKNYYVGKAQLVETMHKMDLCRTQMRLTIENGTDYFAYSPISNHHIICKGNHIDVIDEYFKQIL
ncbi:MAG: hypothetical protein VB122_00830 [Erysipelotrichales bacterium]|nr:hypothetical protein [Erysipelotrichales bacterium]